MSCLYPFSVSIWIPSFKSIILNLTTKLNELELITDLYQATQQLNDIKKIIEKANNELQEINE